MFVKKLLVCSSVITMGLPVQASEENFVKNSINTNCIDTSSNGMTIFERVKIFESKPKMRQKLETQNNNRTKNSNTIFDKARIFEPKTGVFNKQEITELNLSLLNVVRAMQNLGYTAKAVKVNALVTDDNGAPVIEEYRAKTELKDAIRFSKENTVLATFTLDGSAPADHDLWKWSGCENKDPIYTDFYLDLIGFNNYKYKDNEKVCMSDEVPSLISVKTSKDQLFFDNLLRQMLQFPEGKMLIYSIFLNQSLVAKCNLEGLLPKLKQNDFVSLPNWIKSKRKQGTETLYKPEIGLKLIDVTADTKASSSFLPLRTKTKEDRVCIKSGEMFINYNKKACKCLSDDYQGAKVLKWGNKNYDDMLTLFHELCHYLTLEGRNKEIYQKQFPNIPIRYNNTLILKYLEDSFSIPKDHKYSKSEIKILLNDFFKYDNLDEVLAICWNNRGKEYFGNNIYTNLLSFRATGYIRGAHRDTFYVPALNSINLRNGKFELSTHYTDVLQRNCINQMRLFRKENPELLPIHYSACTCKPFEISPSRLLMNVPGYRYVFNMQLPYYLGFCTKYENRMAPYNMVRILVKPLITRNLKIFAKTLIKKQQSKGDLRVKNLADNISNPDLYLHFIACNVIDKDRKNHYDRTEFSKLIEDVTQQVSSFYKKTKNFDKSDLKKFTHKFVRSYLYKICNIENI